MHNIGLLQYFQHEFDVIAGVEKEEQPRSMLGSPREGYATNNGSQIASYFAESDNRINGLFSEFQGHSFDLENYVAMMLMPCLLRLTHH